MQLVKFINDLIPVIEPCLGCVKFGSILQDRATLDAFNLTEENKCCSIIFIEGFKIMSGYEMKPVARTMIRPFRNYCDYIFNMLVLEPSRADLQYHDETQYHEVSESRWKEYIEPKLDCLGCYEFDPCEILDSSYEVIKWNVMPEHNVSANFFDGVRIELIIRRYASSR